ncbi:putative bifunctional diguanylate cyclase/phosphodiesterase [Saccharothrix longispora]|uniref:putative bifunctional diguanylate cyclase/phosphodiesterase n=1 Tax=Saccharothrix longispora TaxID=33920 RepID=UPI0028FD127E|nr:diguanylate cyclase [Saccharothrix longispora]MDU0290852.1 diguanylate cyclase [Saccharothrix longispora]
MSHPTRGPRTTPPERSRELLARTWSYLLSGAAVVPLSRDDLDRELGERLDELCAALHAEPFADRPVERIGERLVSLGYVGEAGLRVTVDVLGKGLLALPEFQPVEAHAQRVLLGVGALSCGFLAANRRSVFEQQESLQLSMLKAVRDARWNLRESEARFDEVVTSSASGVLVADLDGRLVRVNAAIAEMLGRPTDELVGSDLLDLVHPDSRKHLAEALRGLAAGERERVRQSQRLLRGNGDVARISLTVSLVRGGTGPDQPGHFVAVVEDGTELMLLQAELHRQALHDVSTGLPNRQFFTTHLESALRRADPVRGVTLYHLDLDAFGMVCNSLGRATGERLLVHVAQRLTSVLAHEKAMIARLDGDEFAVLVENTATTPDVGTTVAAINRELSEPVYLDGHGLAATVSVGVVRRPPPDSSPTEVLRSAEQALRRAKAGRRGQWELFDPEQGLADRATDLLAVRMPGALEQGELTARYAPVASLADGATTGVSARLLWERPDGAPVDHDACTGLAERTGLVLGLGEWHLATACGQVAWWRQSGFTGALHVGMTRHQWCDGDLVRRVRRVLGDTGLPADRLVVGMPVGVLAEPDAVDGLTVLAELGVGTSLDDFGLGPDDLAAVADLPVRLVRMSRRLVARQLAGDADHLAGLVPLVRAAGAEVLVDGLTTPGQAAWWHRAGAVGGSGPLHGEALEPHVVAARFGPRTG